MQLFYIILILLSFNLYSAPKIIVTIPPIYYLVKDITKGVTEPELLLKANVSPHHYQLKPSEMKKLTSADMVIWVGEDIEGFMRKITLENTIELTQIKQLIHYPQRHNHEHKHEHHEDYDQHIWLSVENAKIIVNHITNYLAQSDKVHQAHYRLNQTLLIAKLNQLKIDLKQNVTPIQNQPYLVLHDAYQYFEKEYQLNYQGSILIQPDRPISAKHIKALREKIQQEKIACIFKEPQFSQKYLLVLQEDLAVHIGELDPLYGKDYFDLMEKIGESFLNCLDFER